MFEAAVDAIVVTNYQRLDLAKNYSVEHTLGGEVDYWEIPSLDTESSSAFDGKKEGNRSRGVVLHEVVIRSKIDRHPIQHFLMKMIL